MAQENSDTAPKRIKRQAPSLAELEVREQKAKQKAARAAQELARIRTAREKETLHRKAAIGEVVIAIAKHDGGYRILDEILNAANAKHIPIDDQHMTIFQSLYPSQK